MNSLFKPIQVRHDNIYAEFQLCKPGAYTTMPVLLERVYTCTSSAMCSLVSLHDPQLSDKTLRSMRNNLWNLALQFVVLAMFDNDGSDNEKETMTVQSSS